MKWLKRWFANKFRKAWEDAPELATVSENSIRSHGMNFTVYRANGGHIIETRIYDRKRDENSMNLHIITDDKNLGEEIGHIITFEHLRA